VPTPQAEALTQTELEAGPDTGAEPPVETGRVSEPEPLGLPEPLVPTEPLVPAQPLATATEGVKPSRSVSARDTGGQSVAEFLTAMLAARLPAGPAAGAPRSEAAAPPIEAGGAPTRPAPDTLSLSAVFGEDPAPLPPAVPAPAAPSDGVSYDEFFGSSAPSARPAKAHDPKSDDLDQFHAWLQNLKR
jgi:nicotinate-nucleotide--dimethylbenzimidazole phosphoribosyltransferase